MSLQIIAVTLEEGGRVDVKVQGSPLSIESYGNVLGTVVRIASNLFADTGEIEQKEAIRLLLKAIQKEAHSPRDINMQRASMQ